MGELDTDTIGLFVTLAGGGIRRGEAAAARWPAGRECPRRDSGKLLDRASYSQGTSAPFADWTARRKRNGAGSLGFRSDLGRIWHD
jgi:hypothetical protein